MEIRKLRFRISGGFAGLVRGAELDGKMLSAAERAAIGRLVAGAASARATEARDLQIYSLEVDTDDGSHRAEFDEMHTPHALGELIQRLLKHARPVTP